MGASDQVPAAGGVRHGRLRPGELAEVAVLGDLSLVLETIGWFVPHIGGAFQALAVVPFSLLSARHRLRAAIVATIAAATVAFLIGGVGIVIQTGIAGLLGASVGIAYRRRWRSGPAVAFTTCVSGLPLVAVTELAYFVSSGFRRLSFAQLRIVWRDVRHVLTAFSLRQAATTGDTVVAWVITHWYVSVPAAELVLVAAVAIACVRLRPFLDQISRDAVDVFSAGARDLVESAPAGRGGDDGWRRRSPGSPAPSPVLVPAPVPLTFRDVGFRYPRREVDALSEVSLEVNPGQFLAIVGPNGSGKSTAVRLMIGRAEPTSGEVSRPGPAGLGVAGGTAVVFQRPESQVLGVRVRDDVIWGLPPAQRPEVAPLLEQVGLGGFEDRETSTLSGGELQRLAVAAALARRPRLLVSDEATAMIDGSGRMEVVALLRRLTSQGMAVVHVTHRREEAEMADVIVAMEEGRVVGSTADDAGFDPFAPTTAPLPPETGPALSPKPVVRTAVLSRSSTPSGARADRDGRRLSGSTETAPAPAQPAPLVSLRDVGYVYSAGTPWSHRALTGIDLDVGRGELVVITGANGSGKSTLAWLLAGLSAPTEGEALIDGAPITDQLDKVGIGFQHARLQLLRPTVLADVSIGADEHRARRALREVGLDPDELGARRMDDLSGGQQRRVALAGILVRQPELIVLDEPYAGLDDSSRRALAAVLRSLLREGIAVVVVSHDLEETEEVADRRVHIEMGRIAAVSDVRRQR